MGYMQLIYNQHSARLPVQQIPNFLQVGLNEPVQPTLRWQPRKESIYAVAISDDGVLCAAGSTANMVQAS